MSTSRKILVTGATGKVGRSFVERVLGGSKPSPSLEVRALCHNRILAPRDGLEILTGSIADRATVRKATRDVTHVLHLATCKETPAQVMDVAVKGLFWLLEACRTSPTLAQFILIGGDASIGHYYYPRTAPVTEREPHAAYPGCYALSKVLEETMLEQYIIQYGLNGCCLRAPWIMEKDDLRYHLSFGEDVFGAPRWRELVGSARAAEYVRTETVPVLLDRDGSSMKRNFVHVDDLVESILAVIDQPRSRGQTLNICMDEPVDYRKMADYLARTRDLPSVEVPSQYHSTWLDNAKAKFVLDWRPSYDMRRLVDAAWTYERADGDPRVVWYPG